MKPLTQRQKFISTIKSLRSIYWRAVGAPLVPTCMFYDLKETLRWIDRTVFPKVFKLRKGAGSSNAKLVHNATEARALAERAFSSGFSAVRHYGQDALKRYRATKKHGDLLKAVKRIPRTLATILSNREMMEVEKGYVFKTSFRITTFDTRVTVYSYCSARQGAGVTASLGGVWPLHQVMCESF